MKINEVFNFLNYLRRKDPLGGSISVPEFTLNCKFGVFKFFKKIMGLPSEYQKGARDPVVGFGLNAISEEKIRPLKAKLTLGSLDSDGEVAYPADYYRKSAAYVPYDPEIGTPRDIEIPFRNDSGFTERRTTVLDPPSLKDPVANLQADTIRFLPTNLTGIRLEYLKYPTEPVMGYVTDIDTAEDVYVNRGAYCKVLTAGSAGNTINLVAGTIDLLSLIALGNYTVLAGDTVEDIMRGLVISVNTGTITHNVKAVYDGERIVLIDLLELYISLITSITGGITEVNEDFTVWSTQFDWENDIEAMNDICEILLDQMGISNRDMNLIQWAAKEEAK